MIVSLKEFLLIQPGFVNIVVAIGIETLEYKYHINRVKLTLHTIQNKALQCSLLRKNQLLLFKDF